MKKIQKTTISFIFFVFLANISMAQKTTIEISCNQQFVAQPPPGYVYDSWVNHYPQNKKYRYLGGVVKLQKDSFCIALYDVNENGIYNENGIDKVVINDAKSEFMCWSDEMCMTSTVLHDKTTVQYFENKFEIERIDTFGRFIILKKSPVFLHTADLLISDSVPNFEVELPSGDKKMLVYVVDNTKEYQFYNFWQAYNQACLDNIPSLAEANNRKNLQIINFFENTQDTRKLIKENPYFGEQFIASPDFIRFFNQNGLPYGVLTHSGKVVEMGITLENALQQIKH